jgi:alkylhydroperoxidase family enzyme
VMSYHNRLATLLAVPTESVERFERGWVIKVFAPVIAFFINRKSRRQPTPLPPDLGNTPFTYLVRSVADLPLASPLCRVLHEAWESPQLPRRTKSLLFAVVARGLGCSLSEHEATRQLQAEGLVQPEIETILANLASPALDAVEAVAVPFARETIWYRAAQIQRRARDVNAQLTREQFLEVIGIVALANAVCRMSAALVVD